MVDSHTFDDIEYMDRIQDEAEAREKRVLPCDPPLELRHTEIGEPKEACCMAVDDTTASDLAEFDDLATDLEVFDL